jgi:hypothetical protein
VNVQEAGEAFCDGEVEPDVENRSVLMSKIFKWYGKDFAQDDKARLGKIAQFCSGSKKEALLTLSKSQQKVHLKYKPYDWAANSK